MNVAVFEERREIYVRWLREGDAQILRSAPLGNAIDICCVEINVGGGGKRVAKTKADTDNESVKLSHRGGGNCKSSWSSALYIVCFDPSPKLVVDFGCLPRLAKYLTN